MQRGATQRTPTCLRRYFAAALSAAAYVDGVTVAALYDHHGSYRHMAARKMAIWALHCSCGMAQGQIAELFNRDRTTINAAIIDVEENFDAPSQQARLQLMLDELARRLPGDDITTTL